MTHYGKPSLEGPTSLFEAVQKAVRLMRYDARKRPGHERVYRDPQPDVTVEPPLVAVAYRLNLGDATHVAVAPDATERERREVLKAAQAAGAPIGTLTFVRKAKPTPTGDLVVKPLVV